MENKINDLWKRINNFLMENIDSQIYNSYLKDSKIEKVGEKEYNIIIQKSGLGLMILKEEVNNIYDNLLNYLNEDIKINFTDDFKKNISINFDDKITQSFENFVVGESNIAAFKACKSACDSPGSIKLNPLFIYGGSGLGKTHLLNAIKNNLIIKGLNVYYNDSMSFRSEYIKMVTIKNNDQLEKLKKYDVFLIDDINLILGGSSTKTMEYFYDVFNYYIGNNKQIVVACDVSPNELDNIKTRLKTRLLSGLTIQIKKPDEKTSRNILIKKLDAYEINLDCETIAHVFKKLGGNGRVIEGFLNNLSFNMIQNNSTMLSIEEIDDIIDQISINDTKTKSNKELFYLICEEFGADPSQIIQKNKNKNIVTIRNNVIWLLKEIKKDLTLEEIGLIINRAHTTISDSYYKVEQKIREDSTFNKSMVIMKKNIINKMNS